MKNRHFKIMMMHFNFRPIFFFFLFHLEKFLKIFSECYYWFTHKKFVKKFSGNSLLTPPPPQDFSQGTTTFVRIENIDFREGSCSSSKKVGSILHWIFFFTLVFGPCCYLQLWSFKRNCTIITTLSELFFLFSKTIKFSS